MKQFTINHNYIGSDLVNFPVLVTSSNTTMLSKMDDGDSLRFTNVANDTEYNYEIEYFDDADEMVVWVNVTSVSSTVDTVFNMYYNNSVVLDGQSVSDTWDSNFLGVWHGVNLTDSTSNNNDLSTVGVALNASGGIGGSFDFEKNDGGDRLSHSTLLDNPPADGVTLELLFRPESFSAWTYMFRKINVQNTNQFLSFCMDPGTTLRYSIEANNVQCYMDSSIVMHTNVWYYYSYAHKDNTALRGNINETTYTDDTSAGTVASGTYGNFTIGLRDGTNDLEYDGLMSEIRLSQTKRSEAWMDATAYSVREISGFLTIGAEQDKPTGATVPEVTTNEATSVEETNATIRGTLTNNGSADTTCWFRYGDETPPTDNNVSQGVIANGASLKYSWQSLTPGVLYYFDTQANNSAGWDTTGGIKHFLTKPNTPTGASCSAGDGWTNVSWTAATGADKYLVRYKSGSAPTSVTDGTSFDNVTVLYVNKSAGAGTHYFSIWSYAYESSPALYHYSDSYDTTSGTESSTTWHSSSFGGSVTVDPTGWQNTAPTVECNSTGSFPANQSTDISVQPTVAAWVNDSNDNESTVWFYNSTDGSTWTLQQTNTTVLNETVTYAYTEASSYNTQYYWKVSANDTHDNTSTSFYFTTEDLTPNSPGSFSAVADSRTQITITWTDQTGADSTRVEQSGNQDASWEIGDHSFVYNGSAQTATNSSLACGTPYYYKAWSYNSTQGVWSDPAWDNDTTTNACPVWHSSSFGGSVTVTGEAIDISIENNSWDGGTPSAGKSFTTNCTFWQNGSVNLDVVIVINSTNGNYTLVNYTDYDSVDEYCGNFSINAWSDETSINVSVWPPNTYILQNFAPGSQLLGFRIWVPKSFSSDKREDFEVILVATEHT